MHKRLVKYFILFTILLCSKKIYASDTATASPEKIDSLLDLCFDFMAKVDTESTLKHAFQALEVSKSINNHLGAIRSYYVIGQALIHNGNYEESLKYLTLGEQVKNAKSFPLYLCQIFKVKGQIYFYLGMHKQSVNQFLKALFYTDKIDESQNRAYLASQIYISLGVIHETHKNYDSAFYYLEKSRELLEDEDEAFVHTNLVNTYSMLGSYHINQNKLTVAEDYLNRALKLTEKYNFLYTSRTYMHLGDLEVKRDSAKSALKYYSKALENLKSTNLIGEFPLVYERISTVFRDMEIPDSAKVYKEKQVLVENELAKEKVNTAGHALQILVDEEKRISSAKSKNLLFYIASVSVLLFLIGMWVRFRRLKKYKKVIRQKEEEALTLKQKLSSSSANILELAKSNIPDFITKFKEVYPVFSKNLNTEHPNLTPAEFELCAMTFLNIPTKKIAQYTFIEYRSVQTKRSRLRKKINLPAEANLHNYLKSFDEVSITRL